MWNYFIGNCCVEKDTADVDVNVSHGFRPVGVAQLDEDASVARVPDSAPSWTPGEGSGADGGEAEQRAQNWPAPSMHGDAASEKHSNAGHSARGEGRTREREVALSAEEKEAEMVQLRRQVGRFCEQAQKEGVAVSLLPRQDTLGQEPDIQPVTAVPVRLRLSSNHAMWSLEGTDNGGIKQVMHHYQTREIVKIEKSVTQLDPDTRVQAVVVTVAGNEVLLGLGSAAERDTFFDNLRIVRRSAEYIAAQQLQGPKGIGGGK